ncbi:MAG: caspase family protein [Polyangiaceae bacterium]|nr:caspase family protein [Polyangiaceae bacterium]
MSDSKISPVRRAVIVGIDDYSGSNLPRLSYCSHDALAIAAGLTHFAQFARDNVALFCEGHGDGARVPNYSDILSAIKDMCDQATEEDMILFFFAGHGTKDEHDSYLLTREFRQNVLADSSISWQR